MKKLLVLTSLVLLIAALALPFYVSADEVYEYITVGETYAETIEDTSSKYYLVKVSESGLYTLSFQTTNTEVWIAGCPESAQDGPYQNPATIEANYDADPYYITYYLSADVVYGLEIMGTSSGSVNTASFTIKPGCAEGSKHGVVSLGEPFTVTAAADERICYAFVAPADGKYMFSGSNVLYYFVNSSNGQVLVGEHYGGLFSQAFGTVHALKAGEHYVICFDQSTRNGGTDTFLVERCDTVNSGEIEILAYYHAGGYLLMLKTDPLGAVVSGVEWSVSDPSVFSTVENGEYIELSALKEGSAVITAKVGGKTFTKTLVTNPTTITLALDKTEQILPFDATLSSADFTPATSGTYRFTATPVKSDLPARFILSKPDGSFLYDNRIGETTIITAELEAGKTYSMYPEGRCFDVTVTKIADAQNPQTPTEETTEPTQPSGNTGNNDSGNTGNTGNTGNNGNSGSNDTTQPTTPSTEPSGSTTEPTKPVEGTKPTDPATTPTQPSLPTVQGDKVEIQIENGGAVVTPDAVEDIIQNGASQTLVVDVSKEADVTFVSMDAQALKLATANNCSVTFVFSDDIRLELDAGCISNVAGKADENGISLKVTPRKSSELNDMQKSTLQSMNVAAIVDIELHCAGDLVHELGSKAYITIPCPDADSGNWSVFYIDEEGKLEEMPVIEKQKDAIIVATEHFSTFVLAENVPQTDEAAQNGGSGWWIALVIIVVLAGGAVAAYFILKKKDMLPAFLKK